MKKNRPSIKNRKMALAQDSHNRRLEISDCIKLWKNRNIFEIFQNKNAENPKITAAKTKVLIAQAELVELKNELDAASFFDKVIP